LLDEHQAAAYLKMSLATIRRYRYGVGGREGLRFVKIGRTIRYARDDLNDFIADCSKGTKPYSTLRDTLAAAQRGSRR
jgi:hypothetical protein